MKKQTNGQERCRPNRKYTLKKEYYAEIAASFDLRERLSKRVGGSPISNRMSANDGSMKFNDLDALMVIAHFFDKDLWDIVDIDTSKPY